MMIAVLFLVLGIIGMVVGLNAIYGQPRVSRRAGRQVVMRELAEHYAVENYVLLSQAVGVLERLLDDDVDLSVFTGNQRRDAEEIVRSFHQRQLPKG